MSSSPFDAIEISEENAAACAAFSHMCKELNVRISNVVAIYETVSDDGLDDSEVLQDQFIEGDVQRIGTDGVFRFRIGNTYGGCYFETLIEIVTGFYWNGNTNGHIAPFPCRADFKVHQDSGRHAIYRLESVLRLTASPGDAGLMWIDSNPELLHGSVTERRLRLPRRIIDAAWRLARRFL